MLPQFQITIFLFHSLQNREGRQGLFSTLQKTSLVSLLFFKCIIQMFFLNLKRNLPEKYKICFYTLEFPPLSAPSTVYISSQLELQQLFVSSLECIFLQFLLQLFRHNRQFYIIPTTNFLGHIKDIFFRVILCMKRYLYSDLYSIDL